MQRVAALPQLPAIAAGACAHTLSRKDCHRVTVYTRRKPVRGVARRTLTCPGAVIGIDLGTSNVAVAVIEDGLPRMLPDAHGRLTSPSVVAFDADGSTLTGFAARERAANNPLNTFSSVKRLIGRRYEDVSAEAAQLPYIIADSGGASGSTAGSSAAATGRTAADVLPAAHDRGQESTASASGGASGGAVMLECPALGRLLAPEEVSAALLRELADRARRHLDADLTGAVVTLPAHFDERQRAATLLAAQLAGLPRVQLLQEPVAAAMAYGLGRREDAETVLVLDLGGGTYDVSLLEGFDGIFEVVTTDGDARLGGDDIDRAIVQWIQRQHEQRGEDWAHCWGCDNGSTSSAMRRLLAAAEAAKVELSSEASTSISTPSCGDLDMRAEQLAAVSAPLLRRLGLPLSRVAAETFLTWSAWPELFDSGTTASSSGQHVSPVAVDRFAPPPRQVSQVVLVGGATRMPAVGAAAEQLAGRPACASIDPELCVALGAAVHAGVLSGDIRDGLELMDGRYSAGWHEQAYGFA